LWRAADASEIVQRHAHDHYVETVAPTPARQRADDPCLVAGSIPTAMTKSDVFRVLIVDDEEAVRLFIERVLRQPGYETTVAADPLEALQLADSHGPFDLLVTDVAMPELSGAELARRLRVSDPALKVLYVTGYSDRLFQERAVLWEGEAFLEKPMSVQGLREAVALLLEGRIPASRGVRVAIPGARVLFAQHAADLVSLSVNGALVHAAHAVPVGTTWPLVLELPAATVKLTARVVSCAPTTDAPPEGTPAAYAVALAFTKPSTRARRDLQRVCSTAAIGRS
jgi:CheY-like chemotaxis protein